MKTQNDIHRTAVKKHSGKMKSDFGRLTNRDTNEMCPYCKNEDTAVILDKAILKPYQEYYSDKVHSFTVVSCYCCNAEFSFYKPKESL